MDPYSPRFCLDESKWIIHSLALYYFRTKKNKVRFRKCAKRQCFVDRRCIGVELADRFFLLQFHTRVGAFYTTAVDAAAAGRNRSIEEIRKETKETRNNLFQSWDIIMISCAIKSHSPNAIALWWTREKCRDISLVFVAPKETHTRALQRWHLISCYHLAAISVTQQEKCNKPILGRRKPTAMHVKHHHRPDLYDVVRTRMTRLFFCQRT